MSKLGKYTTGVSCLYVKRLADVDQKVLKELITRSLKTPLPGADAVARGSSPGGRGIGQ